MLGMWNPLSLRRPAPRPVAEPVVATPVSAPAEQKALGPDLAELFGGVTYTGGIAHSDAEALKVPVVAASIGIISQAVGSLDVAVKRLEDGVEVDAPEHPVARFLRGAPNDWTSWPEFFADLVATALMENIGATALLTRTSDGRIIEAVLYSRSYLSVDLDPATAEPTFRLSDRVLRPADVIYIRPPLGKAPMKLASSAIALAIALDRHGVRLFSRGARPGGILSFPRNFPEAALAKIRAGWQLAHEGEDAGGRTAYLYDEATFQPLTFSSVDAQYLETRRFAIEEICRCFNLPSPMVGDLTRATWSNLEGKHREFFSVTLEPWLQSVEAALRRALFLPEEREHYVIRFDRDDFGRADLSARATSINSLIASRVLSPNEGRAWLGLAPRDGGDEYLNPNISETPAPAAAEEDDDRAE